MNCRSNCLFCEENQSFFVNFTKYHGVCDKHAKQSFLKPRCKWCSGFVPILFKEKIEDKTCEFCFKEFALTKHDCSKFICFNCLSYADKCPVCCDGKIPFEKDDNRDLLKQNKEEVELIEIKTNKMKENHPSLRTFLGLWQETDKIDQMEDNQTTNGLNDILDVKQYYDHISDQMAQFPDTNINPDDFIESNQNHEKTMTRDRKTSKNRLKLILFSTILGLTLFLVFRHLFHHLVEEQILRIFY